MKLEAKVFNGLERLSEALKALLWEQAKAKGISPIQIQILIFVSSHRPDISNVSYLSREFNVTKATISDAVRVLIQKKYLIKDHSPTDNRRYNLILTDQGKNLVQELSAYGLPVQEELKGFTEAELSDLFSTLSQLIYRLNRRDIIQVQRTCFNCQHYSGDKIAQHYCQLLKSDLKKQDIRLDCNEFLD